MSTSSATIPNDGEARAASGSRIAQTESLVAELDGDLRLTLAHLNNADDEVASLTLALLPFGRRSALVGYGIIESNRSGGDDQAVEVHLTSFGREMIVACALHADPVIECRLAELDEAHARRAQESQRPAIHAVPAGRAR